MIKNISIDVNKNHSLRDVLGNYTLKLGEENSSVTAVTADLMGTCRIKSFKEKFPERFFDVGIAEQDMISFAAGLAHEGFIPYVFTMAPFMSMRACEQVRTDVAYANLNVRMIAVYAGLSGGISGATHWSIEDVGIMTSIPDIAVFEPCDAVEAEKLMEATLSYNGPVYMRAAVVPVPDIYEQGDHDFRIGGSRTLLEGNDGAILASGVVVQYAFQAAQQIEVETGRHIRVIDMYSLKPIDREAIINAAKTGHIVVAEDHNIFGGLGSLVSLVLSEEGINTKFKNCGVQDKFVAMAHAPYLYHEFGYDTDGLKKTMLSLF